MTAADVMTRGQRHAFMRIQHASQVLADPDATPRERRSAFVSFYRGFRALSQEYRDPAILASARALDAFTGRMVSQ